jgi:arylsulfatase A-like enzyme/Flp pilus assembly protein TadD
MARKARRAPAPPPPKPSRHPSKPVVIGLALCALLVAAVAAISVWRRAAAPPPGALAGHNVLLVTIDTLRFDKVGAYGGGSLTPVIDALAGSGVRFAHAYAHAPLTLPSHASILTGLSPLGHGVHNNGTFRLDASIETLATRLEAGGYRTGAFVGAFVLDSRFGLARGFDEYDDRYGEERGLLNFGFVERTADRVLAPALAWIEQQPSPWFAWVHLFDPHAPYAAPERVVDEAYDNEVAYTDRALGRFLDRLRAAGRLERTLIVLTADHGESLGDHGETTHGLFAYDATLRVPLVFQAPTLAPAVVPAPRVSHADILPTVLELLGAPAPLVEGRSLRTAFGGDASAVAPRPIYFEALDGLLSRNWAPLTGVIADDDKYIDLPLPELYDLAADPTEQHNLAGPEGRRLTSLAATLSDKQRGRASGARASGAMLDDTTRAALQSLGYVTGEPGAPRPIFTADDDPKRLVEVSERFTLGLRLATDGQLDRALTLFDEAVAARPDFTSAWTGAAAVLLEAGRAADALAWLERAPDAVRTTSGGRRHLAAAYMSLGRPDDTIRTLEPLAADAGMSVDARNMLGIAYTLVGRGDEARQAFERALEVAPHSAGTWNNLGVLALRLGRLDEARRTFREAVARDPGFGDAWMGLGQASVEADPEAAIEAWRRAVDADPRNFDALFNMGMLLAARRPAEAVPVLRQFVETAPADRYAADVRDVRDLLARLERGS